MKKILAFCFFPAFVPPSNGGQSRLFNFYAALSRWHQVTLLTSTHVGVHEEVLSHGTNFIERRIPKDDYFVQQYAMLEQYSGGGDLSGPAIAACGRLPTRLHQVYLEEYQNADVIVHDSPFTADYDIFAGTDSKLRVYNAYNCETILYQQLHAYQKSLPIHDLVRASEERLLSYADLVLYCTDGDLNAFREMLPGTVFDAFYAPNGMVPRARTVNSKATESKNFRAVFMGSGHLPNVSAADFIVDVLAPTLPDISFDIIGSCLPEGQYPINLKRHGVVDDEKKAQLLERANIALNPMTDGSGSNVKVLEYFAFGLPVLSTSFGMRGIQAEAGKDYLEAELDQFAGVLHNAAVDRTELAMIGMSGQTLALMRYTWDAIAQSVAERINALASSKLARGERRYVLALNDYDSFEGVGGGKTRTRGLYETVREWSSVVFMSFSGDGTLGARQHSEGITVITIPKAADHIIEQARVNSQFHVSVDDILASRHCKKNTWMIGIYQVLRQSARCIVVEHCYMAGLPLAWNDRFVYSSQNNETELKRRLLERHPLKQELISEVEHTERLAVECAAAIIVVSQEDAESLVKGKRTAGPVIVVRNGASMPALGEKVERVRGGVRELTGDRAVVFLGSAHMPNVEAAKFIVEQLASQCPEVRFHLLGSVCNTILHVPRNVHLWGVVDEVTKSAVLQSCVLALNPMSIGSGSNVKLADYLGSGLFVLTSEFGQRGYPGSIKDHVVVAPLNQFAEKIRTLRDEPQHYSPEARSSRFSLFERELTMRGLAERFVAALQSLERRKKRVLYVAYRYVVPALGGAEANIEKFVSALGNSGKFDVDVVTPEISGIHNHWRFGENYSFDPTLGVPVDIPNVRFARFPIDTPHQVWMNTCLGKVWRAQPLYEKAIDRQLVGRYAQTGITWGWSYPEGEGSSAARWAFTECGVFLVAASSVDLQGYSSNSVVITAFRGQQMIGGPWSVEGDFHLALQVPAGDITFYTSAPLSVKDPRPLGFLVTYLAVSGRSLDLFASTLIQKTLQSLPAKDIFHILDRAAEESRVPHGVRLTDSRGPWSASMERFITDHVKDYDLVVTHNNVFRPAVVAIAEAEKQGVPSILIPHAHFDDDFYHFPDWMESARGASLVLAVPKVACDFLAEKGCNVRYLPAGCDADEQFTPADQEVFRKMYPSNRPFVLVLGRKAGAKGYRYVVDAVEKLNIEDIDLGVVLIGPDDDGIPIASPNAFYLGRQPRNVVRGALMSCVALVNMSSSESFGIVLLEAWLARKPVIANKNCAAFHDMAVDGENAFLVDPENVGEAMHHLLVQPDLARYLAENGNRQVPLFNWEAVNENFINFCSEIINRK